jgi:hypothetical protein
VLEPQREQSNRNLIFAIFVAGMLALFLATLPSIGSTLPDALATQIGRNGEAYVFAILVAVDIRLRESASRPIGLIIWWIFLGVSYVATEAALGMPQQVVTLSEAFLGAIVVSVFISIFESQDPARWDKRWLFPAGAVLMAIVGELPIGGWEDATASAWITDNAETVGFVALTALLLGYMSPYPWPLARPTLLGRWVWMILLVAVPIGVALVNPNGVDSLAAVGVVESVMVWIQRITESFVAAFLLTGYLWIQDWQRSR